MARGEVLAAMLDPTRHCLLVRRATTVDGNCGAGGDGQEELAFARLHGYAIDDGEIEEGLICVAAPICDMNHRAVGAVSVSGPDYRMQADQELMIREVRRTARNISQLLGFRD